MIERTAGDGVHSVEDAKDFMPTDKLLRRDSHGKS
jgi:hypothetical protein